MTNIPNKPVLQPGPDHKLVLKHTDPKLEIRAGSVLLSAKASALELIEHVYPPVLYIGRDDIDMSLLQRSAHTSWCPYKGEACYFHVNMDNGDKLENVAWSYETPFEHIIDIKNRLAFYTNHVSFKNI